MLIVIFDSGLFIQQACKILSIVVIALEINIMTSSLDCTVHMRLISSLLSFFSGNIVSDLLSTSKLLNNICNLWVLALHPWVSNNITQAKTVLWGKLQQRSNEVLEFWSEEVLWFVRHVGFPEQIGSLSGEQSVVWIIIVSHLERWMASVHDKENYGRSEKIDRVGLVWLLGQNLRCHVSWGTNMASV